VKTLFRLTLIFLGFTLIISNALKASNNYQFGLLEVLLGPISVSLVAFGLIGDFTDDVFDSFSKKKLENSEQSDIRTWYPKVKSLKEFLNQCILILPKNVFVKIIYFPFYIVLNVLNYSVIGLPIIWIFYLLYLINHSIKKKLDLEKSLTFEIDENKIFTFKIKNLYIGNRGVMAKGFPYDKIESAGPWIESWNLSGSIFTILSKDNFFKFKNKSTFRPWWETPRNLQNYTIDFETNGGTLISSITKKYGDTVPLPNNPEREGYIFSGWYSDGTLTTPFQLTQISLNYNKKLYARWSIKETKIIEQTEGKQTKLIKDNQLEIWNLYKEFKDITNKLFSKSQNKIVIDCAKYPVYIEEAVQSAVELKRQGKFNEAIKIYFEIIIKMNKVYPVILEYLYKAVLCTVRLDFAYETIVLAEKFIKGCSGPISSYGKWSQEDKRVEFENLIENIKQINPTILMNTTSFENYNNNQFKDIALSTERKRKVLIDFISNYSGGAVIELPSTADLKKYILNCIELSDMFRERGIIN